MKKLMTVLAALVVASVAIAATEYTNTQGKVFTITETASGVYLTPVATTPVNAPQVFTGAFTVRVDTNSAPTVTAYTPLRYGDVLVGTVSGKVWVATGLTASDWKLLN